jgi:glycosyltransferase involved in cell wall biosynthesis
MPKVTVVMAMYNAAEFLGEAVSSILTQSYQDYELIVVDDCSRDNSLEIIESFKDQRIRVIKHSFNVGASVSRNDALAQARGEFVAIMDADDVCGPKRLEHQVAVLEATPMIGFVGCAVYDNIDAGGAVLHTSHVPEDNDTIQRELMQRWCFFHSSLMFRKSLYELVGGYRKEFEAAEDHDFILRMLEHCQAYNLPERLVSYRLNPAGLSVVDHQFIDALGEVAIRLAERRRRGDPEDLEGEITRSHELCSRHKAVSRRVGVVRNWRNSLYAANRYYGFGCRELCAGHLQQARRCFVRSLRTNGFFVKSWIGVVLSLMPFAATRLKFLFRSSMEQYNGLKLAAS